MVEEKEARLLEEKLLNTERTAKLIKLVNRLIVQGCKLLERQGVAKNEEGKME